MINKVKRPYYVGVDWAKGKWLAFTLNEDGNGFAEKFPNIESLWEKHKDARLILIDMPIGLKNEGLEERLCDKLARKFIGKRRSSVFRVPCRNAIYADIDNANDVNKACCCGKGISPYTFGIIPSIRQIDGFLKDNSEARKTIKEIHPEVCFTALTSGEPMKYNKKQPAGFEERFKVLTSMLSQADGLVREAQNNYKPTGVADDDILDALVAAVTALKGYGNLTFLGNETDSEGLPMQIAYYKSPIPPPPLLAPGSR